MKIQRCKYCQQYNGDGIDDIDGFDYYSCELKNKIDLAEYGVYDSLENSIDENKCIHYLCDNCLFRKE